MEEGTDNKQTEIKKTEITLANGDVVKLKKDWFGWRVIEPPTKWYHYIVGSKRNLFMLIILMFIAGAMYLGITELISQYKVIADNPCEYCKTLSANIINTKNLSLLP